MIQFWAILLTIWTDSACNFETPLFKNPEKQNFLKRFTSFENWFNLKTWLQPEAKNLFSI